MKLKVFSIFIVGFICSEIVRLTYHALNAEYFLVNEDLSLRSVSGSMTLQVPKGTRVLEIDSFDNVLLGCVQIVIDQEVYRGTNGPATEFWLPESYNEKN